MKNLALLFIFGFLSIQAQAVYPKGQSQASSTPPKVNNTQNFPNDAFSDMEKAFMEIESEAEPTLQDEYFLGRAVAANILAIYKPYTTNPALTRYVNLICQTIVINSPHPEVFNGYHALILDSTEFNAFSSPGGHIFITKGLLELTDSEDTLAAVIAHELAHIMLKHSINLINNMRFNDEMSAIADRASVFAGRGSAAAQRLMVFRDSVSSMMDTLLKNGYSQEQELEADQEAIILLAASGYNPMSIMDVLKLMQSIENSRRSGFNTTHPSARERIANVGIWVGSRQVRDNSLLRAARFRKAMAK
jgi:beta-barrel assembly-enhancing protease